MGNELFADQSFNRRINNAVLVLFFLEHPAGPLKKRIYEKVCFFKLGVFYNRRKRRSRDEQVGNCVEIGCPVKRLFYPALAEGPEALASSIFKTRDAKASQTLS